MVTLSTGIEFSRVDPPIKSLAVGGGFCTGFLEEPTDLKILYQSLD